MFSKTCEYAIKACVFIAGQTRQGSRSNLRAIAREIDSPEAFTAKILQQLTRHRLIDSVVGAHGGFQMDEQKAARNRLSQIVKLFDGEDIYKGCGLGMKNCSREKPCPLHDSFMKIREDLREMLEGTTVNDLVKKIETGKVFLKR